MCLVELLNIFNYTACTFLFERVYLDLVDVCDYFSLSYINLYLKILFSGQFIVIYQRQKEYIFLIVHLVMYI